MADLVDDLAPGQSPEDQATDELGEALGELWLQMLGRVVENLQQAAVARPDEALVAHAPGQHDQKRHGWSTKRVSTGGDEGVAFLEAQDHFDATASAESIAAREEYVFGDYQSMGAALRGQEDMTPEVAAKVDALDKAFAEASVSPREEITVRRQVGMNVFGLRDEETGDLVDDGFMSTTVHPLGPEGIELRPGNVYLNITVPPGTPMLAGSLTEGELILPRGTRMEMTGNRFETGRGPGRPPQIIDVRVIL